MRSDVLSVSVCFSTFFVGVLCFNMEKHTTDQRCEHTQTQTTTLKSTMMKQFNSILAVVVAAAVSSHAFAPPQSITVPRTMTTTLSMSAVSVGQSQVLPAGVQKMVTKPGNGFFVKDGDVATVRYSCSIPNGIVFSKSDRQQVVCDELLLLLLCVDVIVFGYMNKLCIKRQTDNNNDDDDNNDIQSILPFTTYIHNHSFTHKFRFPCSF